nr:ABC transporter permease [Saprospiraceae bacterium]
MNNHPPKLALRFLRWFCRADFIEEIEGNLLEIFESQFEGESRWSTLWFYWQVVLHFRPDFIKPNPLMTLFSRSLLRHNLLISYRSFLRNKRSFFINLTGLSSGLACVLLIYLWVADEWQYDRFHEQDQHLYRVLQNHTSPSGINTWKNTPIPLADALKTEVVGITEAVSISSKEENPRGVLSNGDLERISNGIFASPAFFDLFSFPLKEGTVEQVLTKKDAVVLSEQTAKALFPKEESIIGKTIKWRDVALEVTGMFADVPSYSSLQFDFVLHIDLMTERDEHAGKWNGDYARNYVLLKDHTEAEKISSGLGDFLKTGVAQRKRSTLFLQKYSDQYLHGNFKDGFLAGGRISYVKLFSITALFILLIACFNFMNLSTAQAGLKMKEIGVKKTMGAQRYALVGQFLTESLLMTFLSLFMALCLVVFLIPHFNQLTGKSLGLVLGWQTLGVILAIVVITGLVAGSYPAFYLSRFQPKAVLTSDWQGAAGGAWLRKSLVVLQFSLSVLFMVSVFIVNGQLKFIQEKHLGFNRDNVIQFNRSAFTGDYKTFLHELEKLPGVQEVANMATPILAGGGGQSGYSWRGQEEDKKY